MVGSKSNGAEATAKKKDAPVMRVTFQAPSSKQVGVPPSGPSPGDVPKAAKPKTSAKSSEARGSNEKREPVCPFCKAHVASSLLRDGGMCPKCLIEIPGEEAATDPGQGSAEAPKLRLGRAIALVAVLLMSLGLAGGGGALWWIKTHPEPVPEPVDDDFFMMPLDAHQDQEVPGQQESAAKPAATPKRHTNGSSASRPASNGSTASAEPSTSGAPAADPEPTEPAATGPSPGNPLGGPALKRRGLTGITLTDDEQIREMAKRVLELGGKRLEQCYNQRLKDNERLEGSWMVGMTIQTDGTPTNVKVEPQTMSDPQFESCIVRNVGGWKFQAIDQATIVGKTYVFGS